MKLLRVLQSGEFERLGSSTTRKADVRIVSATNADLERAIAAGTFREDLLFRLNVIELRLPALNERSEDILPLSALFLRALAHSRGPDAEAYELADDAQRALLAHDWPGNVRELQNRLQRASLVCQGARIRAIDLGISPARESARVAASAAPPPPPASSARRLNTDAADLPRTVGSGSANASDEAERAQIEAALTGAGGVVAKAAASLGVSRQALYRRMERLGLALERRVRG